MTESNDHNDVRRRKKVNESDITIEKVGRKEEMMKDREKEGSFFSVVVV